MPRVLRLLCASVAMWMAACAPPREAPPTLAFVDVTLIAAYGEPHLQGQTVLVRGDRIVAVGPADRIRVPAHAQIVGRPGRVLAPGLTDMHVHIFQPDDGVLFLANGVTSVRNLAGRAETTALASDIEAGLRPGPTIYSSTPIIDGPQTAWVNPRAVRTFDEMRARIEEESRQGYVGVKLYENLSPEAFAAGVAEARARGLQVYAHVPFSMPLRDVLALKVGSIEHLTGVDRALAPASRSEWEEQRWAEADPSNIAAVAREVASSGVWSDATLVTALATRRAFADMAAAQADPLYRYATPRLRAHWRALQASEAQDRDPDEAWAITRRAHAVRLAFVRALHEADAPLLIGTDAPQPFMYPGYSLHDELALHLDAGLSPAAVLRADTIGAAKFLDRESEFGRIEVGARADMVLLARDPEMDMAALRAPLGVMAAGRWYEAVTLQRMLDDIAARIAAEVRPANPE